MRVSVKATAKNRLVLWEGLDWQGRALNLMFASFAVKRLPRVLWGGFVVVTGGRLDNILLH